MCSKFLSRQKEMLLEYHLKVYCFVENAGKIQHAKGKIKQFALRQELTIDCEGYRKMLLSDVILVLSMTLAPKAIHKQLE